VYAEVPPSPKKFLCSSAVRVNLVVTLGKLRLDPSCYPEKEKCTVYQPGAVTQQIDEKACICSNEAEKVLGVINVYHLCRQYPLQHW